MWEGESGLFVLIWCKVQCCSETAFHVCVPVPPLLILPDAAPAGSTAAAAKPSPAGYTITPLPNRSQPRRAAAAEQDSSASEDDAADDGGWETASDADDDDVVAAGSSDGAAAAAAADGADDDGEWEEWDVCRSFFDNHISSSMQDNLEYMYKRFGFYLPDAEFLVDPEGMLKYLGEKLQYGKVSRALHGEVWAGNVVV